MGIKVGNNKDVARLLVEKFGGYYYEEGNSVLYVSKGKRRYTCRYTESDNINIRPVITYSADGMIAVAKGLIGLVKYDGLDNMQKTLSLKDMVPMENFVVY